MIVSSPIGEFPYRIRQLRVHKRHVLLEGTMGTWPATIELEWRDLASAAGLLALPAVLVALTASVRNGSRR